MTHEELLGKIINYPDIIVFGQHYRALRAVVELHAEDVGSPYDDIVFMCDYCKVAYPCPTIEAIVKELR